MSFSGGVYTLPGPALNTGEVVSAPENNTFRNDVATAFNLTFLRNGTSTATANLPMGGYKLTGLGVATTSGDALSYGQAATVSTLTTSSTVTLSGGTANGVAYLNGSKVLTTGSAFVFDGSKMGIGTSSPTQILSVVGVAFVGSSFNGFSIGDSTAERVRIGYKDGTPDTGLVAAQIMQSGASELHIASRDTGAGAIVFRTGTGISERMRLDASGNLGIGTTTTTSAKTTVATGNTGTTVRSTPALLLVSNGTNTDCNLRFSDGVSYASEVGQQNGGMYFATSGSERMRIDSGGTVFIGATSGIPGAAIAGLQMYNVGGTYGRINIGKTLTGAQVGAAFYYNGTAVGSITYSDTATAYNTSSDYRLKENIQPMQNGLAFCRKQRPVTYDWKADGSKGSGYIAHWMQEDGAGNCVTGEKDAVDKDGKPIYQGIDTSFMVGPLNAGLNELADIVDKQAEMLEQLKAELDATKAEVAALKGN